MTIKVRLLFDSLLIIGTALASWGVTHYQISKQQTYWREQQKVLSNYKLYDTRLAYFERLQRDLIDFSQSSFVSFHKQLGVLAGEYDPKTEAYIVSVW